MSCSSSCDGTTTNCCYDNCGCLYPSTFGCVTHDGLTLENLDVANGEDGASVLTKIDTLIGELEAAIGKVKIDSSDTCPEYLWDKLEEGTNISFVQTGTGCDRKIQIHSSVGGTPVDVKVKISAADTTNGYLIDKVDGGEHISFDTLNPGANEKLELNVNVESLVSTDAGNQIVIGTDGNLKTSYTAPDGSETKIVEGTGVDVTGTGTTADPYVISTNASIYAARPCFDGVWRDVTLQATGNANVVYVSGAPKYRYRHDGSIEFKGSITHTVSFGNYSSGNRKFTITMGTIPTTCLNLTEQAGTADLKSINYIDAPQASADQITQMYGYIIRKSANTIIMEFQSSFTNATAKTIVINMDGVISHPAI